MRPVLKYSALATPILLLLGLAVWLLPVDEAAAAYGCGSCGSTQYTQTVTGTSTVDCPWAEMEAKSQAIAQVDCGPDAIECGQVTSEIVTPCDGSSFPYTATARASFRCRDCDPV